MKTNVAGYARRFGSFGRDARLFLLTVLIFSAGGALYYTDFNLYVQALGFDRSTLGWLMAVSQLAGVAAALPAAALSNRFGRRTVLAFGLGLAWLAIVADLVGTLPGLVVGSVAFGAGTQAWGVVQMPYMAEHTEPEHRNEYFASMFAITNVVNVVAAIAGGTVAESVASGAGLGSSVGPYQVILVGVLLLGALAFGSVFLLADDRPAPHAVRHGPRFGIAIGDRGLFLRLLLPGFLTSLGAGQLIPYLNVFVQGKFSLDLPEINTIFAISSLGMAVAVVIQPALARRLGRIRSIVLVQAASIPFLLVLGFSPLLWMVIAALTVRSSLMNAGGPIFDAFAMERVPEVERATMSAAMTLLWSLGWAIAGPYYAILQGTLGFDAGYAVNFVTIIVLYSIATALMWRWFHGSDAPQAAAVAEGATIAQAAAGAEAALSERVPIEVA